MYFLKRFPLCYWLELRDGCPCLWINSRKSYFHFVFCGGGFYLLETNPFFVGHIHMSYFGATDAPVLYVCWRLLWVSNPEWTALFVLRGGVPSHWKVSSGSSTVYYNLHVLSSFFPTLVYPSLCSWWYLLMSSLWCVIREQKGVGVCTCAVLRLVHAKLKLQQTGFRLASNWFQTGKNAVGLHWYTMCPFTPIF